MADKFCERCGRRFHGRSNRQLRCQPCRQAVAAGESRFAARPGALPERNCGWCGVSFKPRVWNQRFHSSLCTLEARRVASQELYDRDHKRRRKAVELVVNAGGAVCARCGLPIVPGELWDLGHVDGDPSRYAGPEHRRCNRGAPVKRLAELHRRRFV